MNKHVVLAIFTSVLTAICDVCGNETIDLALNSALTNSCVAATKYAIGIPEYGVPQTLFSERSFSNLVVVVSNQVSSCEKQYVLGLTNSVARAVFIAALTECGADIYRNTVVRWFGGQEPLEAGSVKVIGDFISPISTRLEDYFDMHFDEFGVSNLLENAKSAYLSTSNTIAAAAIDAILCGKVRDEKNFLFNNGILEHILDGSSGFNRYTGDQQ